MDNCIFCKIVSGAIPAKMAYQDDELVAFHDINPAALKPLAKAGARVARSAREVADQATAVFVSLPAPAILREVSLGANSIAMGKKAKIVVLQIGRAHD